jgi:hypothetical protein
MRDRLRLTDAELAMILHALRAVQDGRHEYAHDCEHFADCHELSNDEIDTLCRRINCL